MADLLQQVIVHAEVQDAERAFIESRDMLFLATVDSKGQPTCSYKGGDPGFVKVVDAKTLVLPIYDGNGMFLSLGNIGTNAQVGLLFIDFETPHRLRGRPAERSRWMNTRPNARPVRHDADGNRVALDALGAEPRGHLALRPPGGDPLDAGHPPDE